jgi:hypothetical protein
MGKQKCRIKLCGRRPTRRSRRRERWCRSGYAADLLNTTAEYVSNELFAAILHEQDDGNIIALLTLQPQEEIGEFLARPE